MKVEWPNDWFLKISSGRSQTTIKKVGPSPPPALLNENEKKEMQSFDWIENTAMG
jgi:hypothetical protein